MKCKMAELVNQGVALNSRALQASVSIPSSSSRFYRGCSENAFPSRIHQHTSMKMTDCLNSVLWFADTPSVQWHLADMRNSR